MLVLTRKQGEVIQIGDSITITVLRMKGKSVRLGIQAPHEFNVIRGELAFDAVNESITSDKKAAAATKNSKHIVKDAGHYRDGKSWSTSGTRASESTADSATNAWSI